MQDDDVISCPVCESYDEECALCFAPADGVLDECDGEIDAPGLGGATLDWCDVGGEG
jgi:hypothetical protein